ncbi:MAG: hypothetical protein FWC19_10765 [Treponema sp.]|nr:hypothetical protein [Treponema sp.]
MESRLEYIIKRRNYKCDNEFDSPVCNSCNYYIDEYPRIIKLYMMITEYEVENFKETLKRTDRTIFFTLV